MGSAEKKFSVTEESDSKHPSDWGRALAVAISRLVELAHEAGDVVENENLYGEDLHVYVTETAEGANITMSWTPRASKTPEPANQESA